jgi:hypothetical protein
MLKLNGLVSVVKCAVVIVVLLVLALKIYLDTTIPKPDPQKWQVRPMSTSPSELSQPPVYAPTTPVTKPRD